MSTWGNSWLTSWGNSWDRAYVPPTPGTTSGGAVIVDLPKKRKKSRKKRIEEIAKAQAEGFTDEQVNGMAAIYGAQMLARIDPEAVPPEAVEAYAESIIEPFEVPESLFADEPEPVAIDPKQPEDLEEPEDDIALIMAIIEAIG